MISRNLAERIAVALVGVPAILLAGYAGGWWLKSFLLLICALGAGEYLKGTYRTGFHASINAVLVVCWFAALGIAGASLAQGMAAGLALFLIFFLCLGMVMSYRSESPQMLFSFLSRVTWGIFYVSLLYPYLYWVREQNPIDGFAWLLTLLGTLWLGDTVAMGLGQAFGRRKLAPTVSPNKTVVGFISALIAAAPIGFMLGEWLFETETALTVAIGALIISFFGQLGDLVESMWKRSVGLKDSSRIIPGHGGALDRFDSLAFAAPALYFYLTLKTDLPFSG
ncbi:MAG: phosphatidate cytidylyltransferase [Candidatus Zixiibacteriota bacterium]